MSYNNLEGNHKLDAVVQEKILHEKGELIHSKPYWYNPVNKCIYEGEFNADAPNWDNSNIVLNMEIHQQANSLAQAGQTTDDIGVATAGYSSEMYPKVAEYLDIQEQLRKGNKSAFADNLAQGGMLDRRDYLNVKTLQVESRVVLPKPEPHILLSLVDRVATNEFSFKWYKIGTPYDAIVKKVSPQQTFHTGSLKYTTDTASLDIYGSEIGTTFEFRQENFDVNVFQDHLNNLEGQFDRARNETVADIINAISGTAGSDWTATTSNVMDNNPIDDLEVAADAVGAADLGYPNTIISNKKTYRAFAKSTPWVVGNTVGIQSPVVNPIGYQPTSNYIVPAVPVMTGFRWAVDSLIADAAVTVCIPTSIRFWDGPQRTISWMHEQTEEQGVIYKAYWTAKTVETAHFAKKTGVTS